MTFSKINLCSTLLSSKNSFCYIVLFLVSAISFSDIMFVSASEIEAASRTSINTDSIESTQAVQKNPYRSGRQKPSGTGSMDAALALGLEVIWPLNYFKHGATVIRSLASAFSTFDGFCGALEIQAQDGWLIKEVYVASGSIVNQFQFAKGEGNSYQPKEQRSARTLQIRHVQAYLEYYRLYPSSHPIDFDVIVYNSEDEIEESRLHVTKSVCSPAQLGYVNASIVSGEAIPFYIRNSELYADAWGINQISAEYYTSSYILIPHNRSKFPALSE